MTFAGYDLTHTTSFYDCDWCEKPIEEGEEVHIGQKDYCMKCSVDDLRAFFDSLQTLSLMIPELHLQAAE